MKRPRIVITDDNPADRELCVIALERAGWEGDIMCLGTGAELLEALALPNPPDLVFLDLKMPGLSGHEILERIGERTTPPVIVLTSSDWPEEREQVLAHRVVHAYWIKPPQVDQVAQLLKSLVGSPGID